MAVRLDGGLIYFGLAVPILAARGSDQAFASMVAQDRLGLASYMQILRDSWEKARQAPPTRARLGESREQVLARLTGR